MRHRVPAFSRFYVYFLAVSVVVAQAAGLHAQTFGKPSVPTTATGFSPAGETPSAIARVLESGQKLELSGHWADALTQYEEALHEYPEDHALQAKFDIARLHYSLEQRYDDRSFRDSLKTLRPQQSLDLYNDLLSKIDAHYYSDPPWQDIAQRGATAMDIALADENFLRTHAIRVRGQQIDQLRSEIAQLPAL